MKKIIKKIACLVLVIATCCTMAIPFASASNAVATVSDSYEASSVTRGIYKCMVNANGVRIRKEPNTSSTILGQMDWGDIVYVQYWTGDWAYVLCGYPNTGVYGYIYASYLTEVAD